jgi:hypothetical protein
VRRDDLPVLYGIIWLVLFIAPFVGFIDAFGRKPDDFASVGQNRTTWLAALLLGGIFCGFIGSGLGIYYFVALKPKLPAKA